MRKLRKFMVALMLVAVLLPVRLSMLAPLTAGALAQDDFFGHHHDLADAGDDHGRDRDEHDRGDHWDHGNHGDHGDHDGDRDDHHHHHHHHRHHHSGDHDHDHDDR